MPTRLFFSFIILFINLFIISNQTLASAANIEETFEKKYKEFLIKNIGEEIDPQELTNLVKNNPDQTADFFSSINFNIELKKHSSHDNNAWKKIISAILCNLHENATDIKKIIYELNRAAGPGIHRKCNLNLSAENGIWFNLNYQDELPNNTPQSDEKKDRNLDKL